MTSHWLRQAESSVRGLYQRRDQAGKRRLYDPSRAEMVAWLRTRTTAARMALSVAGLGNRLGSISILDVGCGTGEWLGRLADLGADPRRMLGVDLLESRLREGRGVRPAIHLIAGSGWALPVRDSTFDLVCLFTVLSSVPDLDAREMLGREIRRVLRPGGQVLIYDFRIRRPGNTGLVAIGLRDVMDALGGALVWRCSVTLAPPLARLLAPLGVGWVVGAERLLPMLRTHRMYLVEPS